MKKALGIVLVLVALVICAVVLCFHQWPLRRVITSNPKGPDRSAVSVPQATVRMPSEQASRTSLLVHTTEQELLGSAFDKAQVYMAHGKYEEAVAELIAIKGRVTDQQALDVILSHLYTALAKIGRLPGYEAELRRSLTGTATDASVLRELCYLYAGPLRDDGKEGEVLVQYLAYKKDPTCMMKLASLYAGQGRGTEAAKLAEQASTEKGGLPFNRIAVAEMLERSGDTTNAIGLCQQVLNASGAGALELLYAGQMLTRLGSLDLALDASRKALEVSEQNSDTSTKERALMTLYGVMCKQGQGNLIAKDLNQLSQMAKTPVVRDEARQLLETLSVERE